MTIGNRINQLRKKYNYSQDQLANKLGISFQAISKWENGNSSPDIDLLSELSKIFNVSIDYLLDNNRNQINDYNGRYELDNFYWGLEPNHTCFELMKLLPPIKPYKLLDIGCGEGKDAVFFAKNGYQVTAFDASENGIEKTIALAKSNYVPINAFTANINEFVPKETYDLVFSSSVLHLVQKNVAKDLIHNLIENTNPGGIHMIQIHVKKPFINKPPSPDPSIETWLSGELFSLYTDHEILYCNEYVFDCHSGGVLHQHCANKIIARII